MIIRLSRQKLDAVGVDGVPSDTHRTLARRADDRRVAFADDECLKKFHDQIAEHRQYGWDIYEFSDIPPEAILVPRLPDKTESLGGSTDTRPIPRQHRWCRVWVDELGEVRWQSIRCGCSHPGTMASMIATGCTPDSTQHLADEVWHACIDSIPAFRARWGLVRTRVTSK
jgi:hypothetical protein